MVKQLLKDGMIGEAFSVLQQKALAFPGEGFTDRLEQCRTEFSYMSDFMLQGYNDPRRGELFAELTQRLHDLAYDLDVRSDVLEMPYIKGLRKTLQANDTSTETLQSLLLCTTEPKAHCETLSLAFLALFTSFHWKSQQAEEWLTFLTSPQTTPIDSATLTSAISLSTLLHFSLSKALCLAQAYCIATDESVRQRAFVGCVLSLAYARSEDREDVEEVLRCLFKSEQAGRDLLEMQMQMHSCANADKDSSEIRRNLMPNIIRNQPFQITKNGIVEREEEDDITDPDASERRMDELEKSVKRMLDMQKNGADIFFEGFSQMKRYPFFYKMANWFMPFYMEHPDIATYIRQMQSTDFVERVTKLGPFCNSDKYSFAIAFSGVMGQLPDNVREMMKNGEVGPIGMRKEGEEKGSPSMLRLQYLQDLYRFFRLNPIATDITNPYKETSLCKPWTVAANRLGKKELKDMCVYLLKKSDSDSLKHVVPRLLNAFQDKECLERQYCIAQYRMLRKEFATAIEHFNKCLTIKPDSTAAMRGVAKAYYANGNYAKAAFYFDALHTMFPDRTSHALNYAMAMVKDGKVAVVTNELYRLEFENPDDTTIRNTLGWAMLHAGKAEQALTLYRKYDVEKELTEFSVAMNYAYALMFNGLVHEATDLLRAFRARCSDEESKAFPTLVLSNMSDDSDLLATYGYGKAEQAIIVSQL